MQVLLDKWPHPVSTWALEEALPKRDRVVERDISLVRQYACRLRKREAIGRAAIEMIRGRGLRCSDQFHARWGAKAAPGV